MASPPVVVWLTGTVLAMLVGCFVCGPPADDPRPDDDDDDYDVVEMMPIVDRVASEQED